jgi:hypothetical protein
VIDAATRDELVRLRREALGAMASKMDASNDASVDSGNSPEAAQPSADKMKLTTPNGAFALAAPAEGCEEGWVNDIAR